MGCCFLCPLPFIHHCSTSLPVSLLFWQQYRKPRFSGSHLSNTFILSTVRITHTGTLWHMEPEEPEITPLAKIRRFNYWCSRLDRRTRWRVHLIVPDSCTPSTSLPVNKPPPPLLEHMAGSRCQKPLDLCPQVLMLRRDKKRIRE